MVDKPSDSDIHNVGKNDDAAAVSPENPLRHEAGNELAKPTAQQPSQEYRDRAIQYIENMHDDNRTNLPADKLETVRLIERSIVDADEKSLTDCIHGFAGKPVEFENAMNTVVRDMMSVGIPTTWYYTERRQDPRIPPRINDPNAPKDIGHFTINFLNPTGASAVVKFSTEGKPLALGLDSGQMTAATNPSTVLRQVRQSWLSRTM